MEGRAISLGIGRWWTLLLDACFPRQCVTCGTEGDLLCRSCTDVFERPKNIWHPTEIPEPIARVQAFFPYGSPTVRQLLQAYKYSGDKQGIELLWFLTKEHLEREQVGSLFGDSDCICPVPLAPQKQAERGFNQARTIADGVGDFLQKPVCDVLTRTPGKAQAQKDKQERVAIITEQPFLCVKPDMVREKTILLVDDVWTTGSTATAAALALQAAGAKRIEVLTLAYGSAT